MTRLIVETWGSLVQWSSKDNTHLAEEGRSPSDATDRSGQIQLQLCPRNQERYKGALHQILSSVLWLSMGLEEPTMVFDRMRSLTPYRPRHSARVRCSTAKRG